MESLGKRQHIQTVRETRKDVKSREPMVPHTPPLNKGLRVWETVRFSAGYQTIDESLLWLKKKDFRYGKNASYKDVTTSEMDNQQLSS